MNELQFKDYFEKAVKTYSVSLVKIAFTYTKNIYDAEDIVQNIFLKLYEKQIEFDTDEHLKAWLIRCTINSCKDFLKCSWNKSRGDMPEDLSYMPFENRELIEAVLHLKKNYRIVIHLFYYESMSSKEIAEILGISISAVEKRLSRARKMLKEGLEKGDNIYEKTIQGLIWYA